VVDTDHEEQEAVWYVYLFIKPVTVLLIVLQHTDAISENKAFQK
jgi:hypothetical protein